MIVPFRYAAERPAGYGRYTAPILWNLHGCMAMFFLGAAYAKLTEPITLLVVLMGWPAATSAEVVRAVGWVELLLALSQLGPILSSAQTGRALALASTVILGTNAVTMTALYVVRNDPGLAATNLALIFLAAGILFAYRTSPARRGHS